MGLRPPPWKDATPKELGQPGVGVRAPSRCAWARASCSEAGLFYGAGSPERLEGQQGWTQCQDSKSPSPPRAGDL